MKPTYEDLLEALAGVHHQLSTDSDLETVSAPHKYNALTDKAKDLLLRAGYWGAGVPASAGARPKFVGRGAVAAALGVPAYTVRHWLKNGRIPAVRIGNSRYKIPTAWLDEQIAKQKNLGTAAAPKYQPRRTYGA